MTNNRAPLTKTKIEKAEVPPGTRQVMLWDTVVSGFGVRCLPGGSKTFVYRYRPRGGGRRHSSPRNFYSRITVISLFLLMCTKHSQ